MITTYPGLLPQKLSLGVNLQTNEIQLWLISLKEKLETVNSCFDALNENEKERADSFVSKPARLSFVITRACLRQILRAHRQDLSKDFIIPSGAHGKPFLDSSHFPKPLYFNVSHSGDFALIGISKTSEIGVDIEQQRFIPQLASIAERIFTKREMAFIQDHSESQRHFLFYKFWTCKEALLKAEGTGFHRQANTICLLSESSSQNSLSNCFKVNNSSVQWGHLSENYSFAWAIQSLKDQRVSWM